MKKTEEIIGLPVVTISDGIEAGRVKSIIINADKGAIDFIILDSGVQAVGTRVISTDSILGIGEYALTIEGDSAIKDISKIPLAIDLLQKNIQVKRTKVLTKRGRLIGEIGDIYVDEDNKCLITGLEYIRDTAQQPMGIIPRESVITFGKDLLVVVEDIEDTISGVISNEYKGTVEEENAADLFELRQRQYLDGKTATKTIIDSSGNIIVSEGGTIDSNVIDIAKNRGKLMELVMNNRV